MLHDPADDRSKTQLNFNLSSSLSKQNLNKNSSQISSSQLNLLSASTESLTKIDHCKNECLDLQKENLLNSFTLNSCGKSDLLPASNSAEKLSWKFFEQVDTLDNQLRSDVVSKEIFL